MEKAGVEKEKILVVPLEEKQKHIQLLDKINRSDGMSLSDGAMVLGTILMVLGVIYGYIWRWGPILWGLIGLVTGALLGLLLDYLRHRKRARRKGRFKGESGAVLMINCHADAANMLEERLSHYPVMGIGRYEPSPQSIL